MLNFTSKFILGKGESAVVLMYSMVRGTDMRMR